MISIRSLGSFNRTDSYLRALTGINLPRVLSEHGQTGVDALARATPVETGLAAHAWTYDVEISNTSCALAWSNFDVENGFPVVIALQYGYSTGTGGYVAGRDFINPAIRPIFDQIEIDVWKAVTSAR